MQVHQINSDKLTIQKIAEILQSRTSLAISTASAKKIQKCRNFLDAKFNQKSDEIHYGINTGFGALHNKIIASADLEKLQKNLVLSHACGLGNTVPEPIVQLMLLLKIQGLSYGHSGTQLETVQRLTDFYNHQVLPVIFEQGSLGASGDLAPLAHLSLPLIGEGEVWIKGNRQKSSKILASKKWKPLALKSKEGLALLNGTQFMSAYAVWCLIEAMQLSKCADIAGAISCEAYDARMDPFRADVNAIRKQEGQIETARRMRELFKASQLMSASKKHTQDPYSFRCIPQVHGATKDAIHYVQQIVEREINAVTDNPTIFPESGEIISGGNFHGQPLAVSLDFLSIALAELASISERRIFRMIAGERDLPAFLAKNPGLNSGFMIPQYTAASIVSQNKQLATPSSIDSIESSKGQEDHVSMGANAATKCLRIVENVRKVLGIEMMVACQALEFRRPKKSSNELEKIFEEFRKKVPFVANDVYLHPLMEKSIEFTRTL